MKKIAIITARSGSKGLKDKNIIDLNGKPLIAYSIEAASSSGLFERVIVSTDSEQYGEISIRYGAEVMYRGEELSDDKATTYMVLEDVIKRLDSKPEYFVLLQPTSPLRTKQHIIEAVNDFESKLNNFDFLVSVKESEHASVLIKPIDEDQSLKNFNADFSNYRRQGFKEYCPNGAIFIGKVDEYLKQKHFFGKRSLAYVMSQEDSVDIDHQIDLDLAKIIMKKRNNN